MNNNATYFDGKTSAVQKVTIAVFDDIIQIYSAEGSEIIDIFSFRNAVISFTNGCMNIYKDVSRRSYLVIRHDNLLYDQINHQSRKYQNSLYDKLMKLNAGALLGMLIILISSVYFLFVLIIPWFGLKLISKSKEVSLGHQFYNSYMPFAEMDSSATIKASEFADKLMLSNQYPIQVTIIRDTTENAFAIPGGHIIVYTGLLSKLHNYKEFAALLGHESSHINDRHGLKSLLRSVSSSLLFSIILNDMGSMSGLLVQNADKIRTLSFSRSMEEDADKKGMDLLIQNQIDPEGMKELMQELLKSDKDIPQSLSFISTHPLTKERIQSADRFLEHHPNPPLTAHQDLIDLFETLRDH